jgi:dTDP-4-dehydrorhamnose 3,5-epimerase
MKFQPVRLSGIRLIELEPHEDERGFLARTYCADEFRTAGLNTEWPQCNLTLTRRTGAIRGMHFQADPHPETKLIRCVAGAVWDIAVDLRPGSNTYGEWEAFELTADNHRQLYLPGGFAHGFQCRSENTRLFYQMSTPYHPELARGFRWDDPQVNIPWPIEEVELSERDQGLPGLPLP